MFGLAGCNPKQASESTRREIHLDGTCLGQDSVISGSLAPLISADDLTIAACSQRMHRSLQRSGSLHRLQCQLPQLDQRLLLWNGQLHHSTIYSGGKRLAPPAAYATGQHPCKMIFCCGKISGHCGSYHTSSMKVIRHIIFAVPGILLGLMALHCSCAGAASAQLQKACSVALVALACSKCNLCCMFPFHKLLTYSSKLTCVLSTMPFIPQPCAAIFTATCMLLLF